MVSLNVKALVASRRFQLGEGPSREDFFCDSENFDEGLFEALVLKPECFWSTGTCPLATFAHIKGLNPIPGNQYCAHTPQRHNLLQIHIIFQLQVSLQILHEYMQHFCGLQHEVAFTIMLWLHSIHFNFIYLVFAHIVFSHVYKL